MTQRLHWLLLVSVVLALAAPLQIRAQVRQDDPLTDRRVRVTAPQWMEGTTTGRVTAYTHEKLTVQDEVSGEEIDFPLRSIVRLDRYEGNSPALNARHRAVQFAYIFGVVGAVSGPILTEWIPVSMEMGAVVFAGIGAVSGAALGAAYGYLKPRERWRWYVLPFGYDPELRR